MFRSFITKSLFKWGMAVYSGTTVGFLDSPRCQICNVYSNTGLIVLAEDSYDILATGFGPPQHIKAK